MTFIRENLPDPAIYFEDVGLKLTGPRSSKWKTTRCDFHGGSDSMRINVANGCWVCMSCGAKGGDVLAYHQALYGLGFVAAAKVLGAYFEDGKPHQGSARPAQVPIGCETTSLVDLTGLA